MFSPSKTLGFKTKVYVDPGHNCFVVSRSSDYKGSNADIINLSQVTGARSEVKEHKKELYMKTMTHGLYLLYVRLFSIASDVKYK